MDELDGRMDDRGAAACETRCSDLRICGLASAACCDGCIAMVGMVLEGDCSLGYETKTARFVSCGTYTDVVFTGNSCPIPVIQDTRSLTVGVYAGDLHTTTPAYVSCVPSILCGGGVPADPTPDVYAQILELLNNIADGGKPATTERLGVVQIGENLKITEEGVLSVDTATQVEQDNTKPITSAAVHTEIGNIEVLLAAL